MRKKGRARHKGNAMINGALGKVSGVVGASIGTRQVSPEEHATLRRVEIDGIPQLAFQASRHDLGTPSVSCPHHRQRIAQAVQRQVMGANGLCQVGTSDIRGGGSVGCAPKPAGGEGGIAWAQAASANANTPAIGSAVRIRLSS